MLKVIKRDGREVNFNPEKIMNAISKANTSVEEADRATDSECHLVAREIESMESSSTEKLTVEQIQDIVEQSLMKLQRYKLAKNYILYRNERSKARHQKEKVLDYSRAVDGYINASDWRVKENATVGYSIGGLILSNNSAISANYWLTEVYDKHDPRIAEAHRTAAMHIHDLGMLQPYCAGWNLKQLIKEGLGGVPGKTTSAPAKHLGALCNQMCNFLGITAEEFVGAQAFSSFDTYLAPFVRIDHLNYHEVKQAIQNFVFGVNTPCRWGSQAPFTNVTLDLKCPDDQKDLPAIIGGKEQDFTYGDCQEEMNTINKAFIDVMIEGDANGRGFSYPMKAQAWRNGVIYC